jgi:hypothetical protein
MQVLNLASLQEFASDKLAEVAGCVFRLAEEDV